MAARHVGDSLEEAHDAIEDARHKILAAGIGPIVCEGLGNGFLDKQFLDLLGRNVEALAVELFVAVADVVLIDPAGARKTGKCRPLLRREDARLAKRMDGLVPERRARVLRGVQGDGDDIGVRIIDGVLVAREASGLHVLDDLHVADLMPKDAAGKFADFDTQHGDAHAGRGGTAARQ